MLGSVGQVEQVDRCLLDAIALSAQQQERRIRRRSHPRRPAQAANLPPLHGTSWHAALGLAASKTHGWLQSAVENSQQGPSSGLSRGRSPPLLSPGRRYSTRYLHSTLAGYPRRGDHQRFAEASATLQGAVHSCPRLPAKVSGWTCQWLSQPATGVLSIRLSWLDHDRLDEHLALRKGPLTLT